MITLATDNFTRANAATLGANWTDIFALGGGFSIVSNQAVVNASNASLSAYTALAWLADQWSKTSISVINAGGCAVRVSGSSSAATGYFCTANSTFTQLFRLDPSFTFTGIWSDSTAWSSGDIMELDVQGTTLTAIRNGTILGSVVDATYASGSPGIFANPGTCAFSLWFGGNFLLPQQAVAVPRPRVGRNGGTNFGLNIREWF